jgi:hypothetical protein
MREGECTGAADRADLEGGTNFIGERFTPYALAALPRSIWIARLNHEASNVPVEDTVVVVIRGT